MQASNRRFGPEDTPHEGSCMTQEERLEVLTRIDKDLKEIRTRLDDIRLGVTRLEGTATVRDDLDGCVDSLVHAHLWILQEKYEVYDKLETDES